jgi:hypothetical protein
MKITIEDEIVKKLSTGIVGEAAKVICVIAEDLNRKGHAIDITRCTLPCALELRDFKQGHLNDILSTLIGRSSVNIKTLPYDLIVNRVPITVETKELLNHYAENTAPNPSVSTSITVHYQDTGKSYLEMRNTPLGTLLDLLATNPLVTRIEVK